MAWDQYEAISEDLTYIEALKKSKKKNRTWNDFYNGLVDVFGEPFNLRWFFPFPGRNLESLHQDMLNQGMPEAYRPKFVYSVSCNERFEINCLEIQC
jgi:hypothetical protein